MFGSLLKAAAAIVDVPVAVGRDIVTMAGQAFGEEPKSGTHTGDALGRFVDNVEKATKPDNE